MVGLKNMVGYAGARARNAKDKRFAHDARKPEIGAPKLTVHGSDSQSRHES